MVVEACMNPKLALEDSDDDDDDKPLAYRRKPNRVSAELRNSNPSSMKTDRQPAGKLSLGVGTPDVRNLNDLKGKKIQSSKPSSLKASLIKQGSTLSPSRPQQSPPPSSPSRLLKSSAKHQLKKDTANNVTISVPVDEGRTIAVKEEKSADPGDDKSLSLRCGVGLQKSNVKIDDIRIDFGDSDDEKPLSSRLNRGRASNGLSRNRLPIDSFEPPEESGDEKPLSFRYQKNSNVGTSSSKDEDSAEDKPSVCRVENGSFKRENPYKIPVKSAKKAKFSDASTSANGKHYSQNSEAEHDDNDDDAPIAHRLNKAASSSASKTALVKRKIAKAPNSKIKKFNEKSKKITKNSSYCKSAKELPKSGGAQKWTTLVHNGVSFPPPYQPHGVKMLYDGKPVNLTPEQEEAATLYAQMLDTDYVKNDIFNENFFNDWKILLGQDHVIQEFVRCDFRPIYEWHLMEKENKKLRSSAEKKALKEEKNKLNEKYNWAIVDGVKEKVGNFNVEPPILFKGRGKHPLIGRIKKRIYPKDITINIGKDAPIPESPFPDQSWKEVKHDNTVTWLAYWKNPINPKLYKYVGLGASSTLKGQSDKEKYEKARKLKDYIEGIRKAYTKDFKSKDITTRQIAVATYLIDRLALRAGNEKDDDEADTVGCCTLKVENVKTIPPNILEFDFIGKDSIKYYKQFEAEPLVYKAVEEFRQRKCRGDDLFDKLDTNKLNAHLKKLMPGLTAKVFRTFNASITLDEMLAQGVGSAELPEKVAIYQHANKEVAIICNHQRTVSKSHSAQMERLTTKIDGLKAELSDLEADLVRAIKGKAPLENRDGKQKRNMTADAIEKKIRTTKAKIEKFERDKHSREELKEIALGTSKINYLDPRITVAWCKRNEVPIEKLFNKSLLAKFVWAMDTEPSFRF